MDKTSALRQCSVKAEKNYNKTSIRILKLFSHVDSLKPFEWESAIRPNALNLTNSVIQFVTQVVLSKFNWMFYILAITKHCLTI